MQYYLMGVVHFAVTSLTPFYRNACLTPTTPSLVLGQYGSHALGAALFWLFAG